MTCSKKILGRRARWARNCPRAVPNPPDGLIVSVSGPYGHCECGKHDEPGLAVRADHEDSFVELLFLDGSTWSGARVSDVDLL